MWKAVRMKCVANCSYKFCRKLNTKCTKSAIEVDRDSIPNYINKWKILHLCLESCELKKIIRNWKIFETILMKSKKLRKEFVGISRYRNHMSTIFQQWAWLTQSDQTKTLIESFGYPAVIFSYNFNNFYIFAWHAMKNIHSENVVKNFQTVFFPHCVGSRGLISFRYWNP